MQTAHSRRTDDYRIQEAICESGEVQGAFLAALIEDLADEWLSKAVYAYRWAVPEHTGWTGRLIAYDQRFGGGRASIEKTGQEFGSRRTVSPTRARPSSTRAAAWMS